MEELRFLEEAAGFSRTDPSGKEFRNTYTTDEAAVHRIVKPSILLWKGYAMEMAVAGLLRGEKSASDRTEGNRKKYSGRKSCLYFRQTFL